MIAATRGVPSMGPLAPSGGKKEQGPTAALAFLSLAMWLCNLQNLKDGRETESLSLRQL